MYVSRKLARTSVLTLIALHCMLLGFLRPAAVAYPEQPINMIVAFAPGGGTDLVARAIAPYIEKHLGDGAKIINGSLKQVSES